MNEKNIENVQSKISSFSLSQIFYYAIKRLFDIIVSLIGMVFLIPIYLFVRLASFLTGDFHKIIYTHERIGKDGINFKLYKFRSMVVNADEELKRILKEDKKLKKEYEVNKKLNDDPRITKVGRFIRRYSIDELPQLINIFLGDMAIIGNRPYLPREKKDMGHFYNDIVKTKPGLTGYWQVSGRNDVSFKRRLELEQYYSNHQGFKMDLHLFFKTFGVVLHGRGAK